LTANKVSEFGFELYSKSERETEIHIRENENYNNGNNKNKIHLYNTHYSLNNEKEFGTRNSNNYNSIQFLRPPETKSKMREKLIKTANLFQFESNSVERINRINDL
jgi:hypothetical protein